MNILCDTCSVLMLIRIAPDMFIDEQFECATVKEVHEEVFRTQKFKSKFPWRKNYKSKISPNYALRNNTDDYKLSVDTISQLIDAFAINKKTGRIFDLSKRDKKIAAYAITYKLKISSDDKDLITFLEQEFDIKNKTPLAIVNDWIKKGLITWNDDLQNIMEDWKLNNEPPQPDSEKKKFRKLTGYKYLGS